MSNEDDADLVGCEESQSVTAALRAVGREAYSCDILDTRGRPEWHIKGDIVDVLRSRKWRLIVLHPDCTALALSGNRWYGKGMQKHRQRQLAIDWTVMLWNLAKSCGESVCLENPASVIFKHLEGANVQYIQPWMFGHGETKKTGLALWNLPKLIPTNIVDGREHRVWKMPPGKNRKRDRSATYHGIANAIANQWGNPQPCEACDGMSNEECEKILARGE